jgi:DNA-binding IclR family transcriptional regulator
MARLSLPKADFKYKLSGMVRSTRSRAARRRATASAAEGYAAPALEKGLDILELLAGEGAFGLTQKQVADRLGRSASEIFRMLVVLQRRGYVRRATPAETYHLTARLFELAQRHPPVAGLLDAAVPQLRQVADQAGQSCHLAVREGDSVLMLAKADSPGPRGFSVRVGSRFDLHTVASGRILLAFSPEPADGQRQPGLEAIRRRGFERHRSATIRGVIDLSCPVLDHQGHAVAAMTIPYLTHRGERRQTIDAALAALVRASGLVSLAIGGRTPPFT